MANEYLTRTPTSTGNRKVFTYSCWIKRNKITDWMRLFSIMDGNTDAIIQLTNVDKLRFRDEVTGPDIDYISSRPLRDVGSWMHLLVAIDTTAIQAEHRIRMYINGDSLIEHGLDTESMPGDRNLDLQFNNSSLEHRFFARNNDSEYFVGEAFDLFWVDGQALTPDVFGFNKDGDGYISVGSTQATDFRPGQWVPKAPRTIKSEINRKGGFGVNGFYLPMNDSSNFGADFHCDIDSIIKLKGEDLPQPRNGAPTTTDSYVSQLRSDPYASNLVLAIPGISGGQGSGYGDYSADIKGSGSNKTVTAYGNAGIAVTASYYGSAIRFDGTEDYMEVGSAGESDFNFGAGDFTVEAWMNFVSFVDSPGFGIWDGDNNERQWLIYFNSSGRPRYFTSTDGSGSVNIQHNVNHTTNEWIHVAMERNGSTLSGYINGVAVGINTNLGSSSLFTTTGDKLELGRWSYTNGNDGNYFLQDLRIYKGVAKYKGGFDVPKPYTPVGIGTWRAVSDTCKNNFATLNPNFGVGRQDQQTYSNGNLKVVSSATSGSDTTAPSTMAIKGKIYCEFALTDDGLGAYVGVMKYNTALTNNGVDTTASSDCWLIRGDNEHKANGEGGGGSSYGTGTWSTGDIIMMAVDIDNTSIWFGKNGTWYASGDPAANSNAAYTNLPSTDDLLTMCGDNYSSETPTIDVNFGQNPTFGGTKTAGTYTDGNGRGLFKYQPPTGFLAMCEDNLPTPAIADPGEHFKCVLWTGVDGTNKIKCGFQPDFVWIKNRDYVNWHSLYDSIRGPYLELNSNENSADRDRSSNDGLRSFDSDGFTSGLDDNTGGRAGDSYVAWCWKAGGAAVANTDGSINSQVSANQTAGFSIVSYTGNNTAGATIGHGLGKKPSFILVKERYSPGNSISAWQVYHSSLGATQRIQLNLSNSADTVSNIWNDTEPTSDVFTIGSSGAMNENTGTYISYCWAEIEGFSKFGSYVGNASADGTFVYCGFKPAFVITKRTDGTSNWLIHDSSRDSVNPVMGALYTNSADAEGSAVRVDFVSNGFKHKNADGGTANNYANNYIFIAFAESPFQTANAK